MSNVLLIISFCVKSKYTIVLRFKRKLQCVNISALYLQTSLVITRFFDKQYLENK